MSRQPPNNDDQFTSDLEAIEHAMNSMMQGAFSMVFKELLGANNTIFKQLPQTTTIIDGNNMSTTHRNNDLSIEDEFGGSDFKRLANRHKQNRGITTEGESSRAAETSPPPPPPSLGGNSILPGIIAAAAGSIFNQLIHPDIVPKTNAGDIVARQQQPALIEESQNNKDDDHNRGGWSFTSTSSRTVYNADGSQETIITKKTNGVTETIRQMHYPDGRVEESREQKNSFWNRIFG